MLVLILASAISTYAGAMECCTWCGGQGVAIDCVQVACMQCGGRGMQNSCIGCGGGGKQYVGFGMVMPCAMCFGRGKMPCFGCWGARVQMKFINNVRCKACNGNKMVTPEMNIRIKARLNMLNNMIMMMNNSINQYNTNKPANMPTYKPASFGMDRTCSICGLKWYAFPGAMSCPKCSAPEYH